MGRFNEQKYYREKNRLAHGEMMCAYLREAIREADEAQDYEWQIALRKEYIEECGFYWDVLEIYVVMPKLLKLYDDHAAQYGEDKEEYRDIVWYYKWLLGDAEEFYQISIEQFERLAEDFRDRCLRAGYSLRSYYQKLRDFYIYIDREKAEECHRNYLRSDRDRMSDCKACERSQEVWFLLESGQLQKARERAKILFERKLSCKEVPEATYGDFLRYYNLNICRGKEEDAEHAAECCEAVAKAICIKKLCNESLGDVLLYYSLTDQRKALNWFKRSWQEDESSRNPKSRLYYAFGMLRFIKRLQGRGATYRMKLPSAFPLYQEDGVYDLGELWEHYDSYAQDCVRKLDGRNGTTYFREIYDVIVG